MSWLVSGVLAVNLRIQPQGQVSAYSAACAAVQLHLQVAGKYAVVLTQSAGDNGEGVGDAVLGVLKGQFSTEAREATAPWESL